MKNKKLSRDEEKALIKRIRNEDETAKEWLALRSLEIMANSIHHYEQKKGLIFNEEEKKDLISDFILKILMEIKRRHIKKSLFGYIKKMAINTLSDQGRRIKAGRYIKEVNPIIDKEKGITAIDICEDQKAVIPGSKKYYGPSSETEEERILREYKKSISPEIRRSIDLCLEYIEELYRAKKKIKSRHNQDLKIINILQETKCKLRYKLGGKIEKKIPKYNELKSKNRNTLSEIEKRELEDLKNYDELQYFIEINKLIDKVTRSFYVDFWYCLGAYLILAIPFNIEDIYKNIPNLRIKPPRLMFEILSNVSELKKGNYIDLKKVRTIFYYLKMISKGTKKEFLFESIKDNLSNFESVRTSQYKKSPQKRFCKKFVKHVYNRSFKQKARLKSDRLLFMCGIESGIISKEEAMLINAKTKSLLSDAGTI